MTEYVNPFDAGGLYTPRFRWLDRVDGLTAREKELYGLLARTTGKAAAECSPRLSWLIAELDDAPERNVRRWLARLQMFALIEVDRSGNRLGRPSVYRFLRHPAMGTSDLRVETTPRSEQPGGSNSAQPVGQINPESPGQIDPETPGLKQRALFKSSEREDLREPSEEKRRTRARVTDPVFEHWVLVMGWRQPTLSEDRKRVLKARRREGYTDEQLCQAIDGATRSDFYMGRDPKHPGKKNDLTTILKSGARIEEHIERLSDAPPPAQKVKQPGRVDVAAPNEESPWLKAN